MTINLHLPSQTEQLKPKITVIGVGGAGGNAVNNMIAANLEGVDFVMANTDAQALESAMTDRVIQLGANVTRGLGAGASPEVGRSAAEEALEEIADYIEGSNMVFITAGMGGGTGTGAAPVIAQLAREQGILTVGVVTKPFQFEGTHRMRTADNGIEELQSYVDTLIVIPNQNLFRIANEKTTFADAFRMADEVLHSGVRGVTDLMVKPGLVNLDFADIRAVMSEMGKAMMGTGEAEGEKRAIEAAESAISNPLLDDVSLNGAHAVLINITGGPDMTLFEVDEAANRIRDEVDQDANIIFGSTFSDAMEGRMRVSVVATGIESAEQRQARPAKTMAQAPEKKPFAFTPKQPLQRERTPAEIVRAAGTNSPNELVQKNQPEPVSLRNKESMKPAATTPAESAPQSLFDDAPAAMTPPKAPLRSRELEAAAEEEAAGAQDDGLFISPRAEQPVQRTHFISQQKAEPEEAYDDEEEDEGSALGFFQKFTGGNKRTRPARMEEEDEEAPRRGSRAEVKSSAAPALDEEEEYLDIPAFLRRQAN
ncbi:MAG: cell division protein FtsZ [Rickettsiales bacterium]|nr:cell division protein FtsZ [Rickettsiales bacterium]